MKVSLISSSRGIAIGGADAVESTAISARGGISTVLEYDCWIIEAASNGFERRADVIFNICCSISWCSDCTRANKSASNGSISISAPL